MKKHIPNMLTLGNLICGCLGIIFTLRGDTFTGVIFVLPALVFDFLDGFVARLLKVSSPIGKELDSLADMVTFGVLPGMIILSLFSYSYFIAADLNSVLDPGPAYMQFMTYAIAKEPDGLSNYMNLIALIFPLFAALRLAKFNVDESQSDSFVGVPTPAATMFVVGLLFLFDQEFLISENGKWLLVALTIFISLAMVAPIRMLNLKFKTYGIKENLFRYLLIVICLTSLAVFQLGGLSIAIVLYILLSIVNNVVTKSAKI